MNPEQVLALYQARQKFYAPLHAKQQEVLSVYRGETQIDLPDLDVSRGSSVVNLLAQGVDQIAGRIASVPPQNIFVPDNPTQRTAIRRASTAGRVLDAWNEMDGMGIQNRVRARHFVALAQSPVTIRWDHKASRPVRDIRKPGDCYPSPTSIDGTEDPTDVIFAFRRSVGWLKSMGYGGQVYAITGRNDTHQDVEMLLLEYVDEYGRMLVLTGYMHSLGLQTWMAPAFSPQQSARAVLLEYSNMDYPCMTAFVPSRFGLDGTVGQFDSMIGMFYTQGRLMALELIAIEKGIFPDVYLESRQGEQARFIDGPYDGRSGNINIVAGGVIQQTNANPGYQTGPMINTLERNQRVTAGIPADFGGESASNIRTGRRGDSVMSAAIDFPIAEAQDILARSQMREQKAMIALAKMYDGANSRTFYVGAGNNRKPVTFVANEVFTHDEHSVSYPVSGTDMNSLLIGLGQRVGGGWMSTATAAQLDPFISDPEGEHDKIQAEGLERALLQSLEQGVASGQIPPLVMAKITTLVLSDKMELADAMNKVTQDAAKAQAEQAAQAQAGAAGPPTPDQQMAPAAQAGLAGAIPGASGDQQNLAGLLSTLRKPTMTIQPLRGSDRGAV